MIDTSFVYDLLKSDLPSQNDGEGQICEAMSYSVLGGGKRLRAILLLESFRLFSEDTDLEKVMAWPFACAIEYIHAYSLVHDDLPAMDNDTYRRGALTTHKRFGHAMGVLTGDALLNYAMETVSKAGVKLLEYKPDYMDDNIRNFMKAQSILFEKSGFDGMIGGQVLDVCVDEDKEPDKESLYRIYELKTSRLFEAAMCCGSVLAGAGDNEVSQMREAAVKLGIAFQIRDDILDVTASFKETGKDAGSDEKNGKKTYVALYGIEAAKNTVNELVEDIRRILKGLAEDYSAFDELLTKIFG